jgi:RNA recognition motif-containing protein
MPGTKLFVGNLSWSVDSEKLRETFAEHGTVESAKVIEGKGFGFVEMSSQIEAENAKKALNGTDLMGRTLNVDEAKPPQKDRSRQGGGGRGRY